MSDRCHVATRKGLFTLERKRSGWSIARVSFLGDNCTLVMHDPRPLRGSRNRSSPRASGALIAALDHGHFGVNVQDPHMIAQCAAQPEVLWGQHHNGIFNSVDGASSWTEIKRVKPSG